ncbi:MAG TPA: hypothetical protein VFS75_02650, partial [Candidatus Paceibacterota bacterium]|nr:hypothetical protein [Candidatus Paceibacterota bacterium]
RKAELFDLFFLEMAKLIRVGAAIDALDGVIPTNDLIHPDYREALNPFLEALTDDELNEMLKNIMPAIVQLEVGAKKVIIEWK